MTIAYDKTLGWQNTDTTSTAPVDLTHYLNGATILFIGTHGEFPDGRKWVVNSIDGLGQYVLHVWHADASAVVTVFSLPKEAAAVLAMYYGA